jgi:CDP-diglyceride synthetase
VHALAPAIRLLPPCKTVHCFDPVGSAGAYSALAALLAGFALASIVVLIEGRRGRSEDSKDKIDGALAVFVSALVSLTISTFLYATIVGEERSAPRAAALIYLSSTAFSLAILTLFYGLVLLLAHTGFDLAAKFAGRTSASQDPDISHHHHRSAATIGSSPWHLPI